MVKNHHNGYPYLNLSLFFWKFPGTSYLLVKLIGQWISENEGRGITKNISKRNFHFWNSTTNFSKVGTISKAEMSQKVPENFPFFKFQTPQAFWQNWLVNEFQETKGGGLLGIFNFFHQHSTKNGHKVGTIYKAEM